MYELYRNFLMGLGSRRLKHIKGNELSSSPIFPVHPDRSIIAIFQEEYCEIMKILAWMKILGRLLAICNRSPMYCNVNKTVQCIGDLLCPHFVECDCFHKYLCVKVGRLILVAEAGKIFLTRAFLEEIFAVSNFDALGSWGKHSCWAGCVWLSWTVLGCNWL